MNARWIANRSALRDLLQTHPEWTNEMYAQTLGMSISWVKDWKRILKDADASRQELVMGRARYRRQPFDAYDAEVIAEVLDIRDNPPHYCGGRIPGQDAIQFELNERLQATDKRYPRSTSTIWRILDENQRIQRTKKTIKGTLPRPEPLVHWEIDFADVTTASPDPEGKKQHVVEMFNVVDRGTSILIESTASEDYNSETAIMSMIDALTRWGVPKVITMDRDPRFIGGYQRDTFPSAFMRFLLCIGVNLSICPPRRPDLKPYVERIHRTIHEECLQKTRPKTAAQTREALRTFRARYNNKRPHQGDACGNQPPFVAFPVLQLLQGIRPIPEVIDPDAWLSFADGKFFTRRVRANGSVTIDRRSYHIARHLSGQEVSLQVNAEQREFRVLHQRQLIKTIPIKGLHEGLLDIEAYIKLILKEARTEWRETKRLVRQRRLDWAA